MGKTIVIGGPSSRSADEAQLLHEEQEMELLQDVHVSYTHNALLDFLARLRLMASYCDRSLSVGSQYFASNNIFS